jgi:hypothetical protein
MNSGLRLLPAIYTFTIVINFGGILESALPLLYFDRIPWWGRIIFVLGVAIIVFLVVMLIIVPVLRRKMLNSINLSNNMHLLESEKLNDEENSADKVKKERITETDEKIKHKKLKNQLNNLDEEHLSTNPETYEYLYDCISSPNPKNSQGFKEQTILKNESELRTTSDKNSKKYKAKLSKKHVRLELSKK